MFIFAKPLHTSGITKVLLVTHKSYLRKRVHASVCMYTGVCVDVLNSMYMCKHVRDHNVLPRRTNFKRVTTSLFKAAACAILLRKQIIP